MSVQFGRWNFDGQAPAQDYIEKVSAVLAPYGPDSSEAYSIDGVKILYRAFHTTKEAHHETQPHLCSSGAIITWDGRLDNRAELISELHRGLTSDFTDLGIVAAAYESWGIGCFAKILGDWALSIWNPNTRSLILAKDPFGVRHLYYSLDRDKVTWSTILDPLIRFAGKTFSLCEEYIAGYFSMFPAAHLTPYVGIHAVPPSSTVLLRPGKHTISKYWDFDPSKKIHYRTDREYEEHFRTVFAQAVHRRLRSDRPVLAELSGGMDSSSIVCMADTIIASNGTDTPRLDTVSWYDDTNPGLDERPFFTRVEEERGRTGCHIDLAALRQTDVGPQGYLASEFADGRFAATPISNRPLSELFQQFAAHMRSQGHRITLSGIGGEEATGGGVPMPRPELQNLLARVRFMKLACQLNAWAVKMRKPRFPLLWEAARGFFLRSPLGVYSAPPTPWFASGFARRNRNALLGYPSRVKLFGALPSFQHSILELDHERRFLAYYGLHSEWLREARFPYLDRDLLEFAYAIPREQLVRVGQRRSLMKRALAGIVPDELLNRKQKTFVPHEPLTSVRKDSLTDMERDLILNSVGIVDPTRFLEALQRAQHNGVSSLHTLSRALTLESWLRHLTIRGVLAIPDVNAEARAHSVS